MKFFRKLLGLDRPTARETVDPMALQAQAIEINPSNPAQLLRHVGRLVNLYSALDRDRTRIDVATEISQRKAAITAFGHVAPETEEEARALLARLEN